MTDTTKKLMTLEQVLDLIIQAANGESKISRAGCRELADAINANIAAQREDVFENTYHGVLLSKMVDMLRNNEWAELFTGEQVIADLQAEIARLVAAQREGEVVAYVPIHPKIGPLWANATATPNSENVPQHYPLMALYGIPPRPRASMTVTDSDIGVALFAWCAKSGYSNIERMRAALEAIMSKPHYEVRALYEHPASKTHAAVTVTEDEIDVACIAAAKAYGGTIQPADVDRIAVRAAIDAVLKGK